MEAASESINKPDHKTVDFKAHTRPLPAGLFISHGAPSLAVEANPAADFLRRLGRTLARPRAVVVATAHWVSEEPLVSRDPAPATIHDFRGFGPEPESLHYPAPGDPGLADEIVGLLRAGGLPAAAVSRNGRDHGTWIPLMLIWPEAAVPVVEISVQPMRDAAWHLRLGQALAPLTKRDVLIVGSGALTHDLGSFFARLGRGTPPTAKQVDPAAAAFSHWVAETLAQGDLAQLLSWDRRAPAATIAHPTPEHFLPLFVALGAACVPSRAAKDGSRRPCGAMPVAHRLYHGFDRGALAMDCYAFYNRSCS